MRSPRALRCAMNSTSSTWAQARAPTCARRRRCCRTGKSGHSSTATRLYGKRQRRSSAVGPIRTTRDGEILHLKKDALDIAVTFANADLAQSTPALLAGCSASRDRVGVLRSRVGRLYPHARQGRRDRAGPRSMRRSPTTACNAGHRIARPTIRWSLPFIVTRCATRGWTGGGTARCRASRRPVSPQRLPRARGREPLAARARRPHAD